MKRKLMCSVTVLGFLLNATAVQASLVAQSSGAQAAPVDSCAPRISPIVQLSPEAQAQQQYQYLLCKIDSLQASAQAANAQVASLQSAVHALQGMPAALPVVSGLEIGSSSQGQVGVVGMNYYIAVQGVFPSQGGGSSALETLLGQIMLFSGNFAPTGWLPCDGRLMPINQYQALFSVIGTYYGGDGISNFALPNLRGRVPMGPSM